MDKKYETMSVAELERASNLYIRRHWDNGGRSEYDSTTNDISRALIAAFQRERGKCLLGNINLNEKDKALPNYRFTLYTGQTIHNFEYGFIVAEEDEELRRMIVACSRKQPTDMNLFRRILVRIDALGGCLLWWS